MGETTWSTSRDPASVLPLAWSSCEAGTLTGPLNGLLAPWPPVCGVCLAGALGPGVDEPGVPSPVP